MRVLPVNPNTVLVELEDLAQTLGLLASLQAEPVAGIDELIPGARTLLIRFDPLVLARADLVEQVGRRPLDLSESRPGERVEIPQRRRVKFKASPKFEAVAENGSGALEWRPITARRAARRDT